jgi:hypothetical protein
MRSSEAHRHVDELALTFLGSCVRGTRLCVLCRDQYRMGCGLGALNRIADS